MHIYFLRPHPWGIGDFQQIVEFGGGTGDNIILFQEMSFSGVHIVLDLPAMLLVQHHFTKYCGYSAYFGADISPQKSSIVSQYHQDSLKGGNIVLDSLITDRNIFWGHFNPNFTTDILFIPTYSLTERREENILDFQNTLSICGTIFITCFRAFNGQETFELMKSWGESLRITYFVCM